MHRSDAAKILVSVDFLQGVDRGPAYTATGRHSPRQSVEPVPGPGEYEAVKPAAGAAYTIAGKPASPDPRTAQTPGPGEYGVAGAVDKGPACTMAAKTQPLQNDQCALCSCTCVHLHHPRLQPVYCVGLSFAA